jgi:hypothetical protein
MYSCVFLRLTRTLLASFACLPQGGGPKDLN